MSERDIPGVVQIDLDTDTGKLKKPRIVPWNESATIGEPGVRREPNPHPKIRELEKDGVRVGPDGQRWRSVKQKVSVPLPDPIVKRTPQERVESLLAKLMHEFNTRGSLPASVLDELARLISGIRGRQITAADLRVLAAWHLEQAEREQAIHDADYVTTPSPNGVSPTPVTKASEPADAGVPVIRGEE